MTGVLLALLRYIGIILEEEVPVVDFDHTESEGPLMRPKVRRRGEVSLEMTAVEIITLAVNAAQNGWPSDAHGCDSGAMRVVMGEVFEQVIQANRRAVSER